MHAMRTRQLSVFAVVALGVTVLPVRGQDGSRGEEKVFDADFGSATIDVSEYTPEMQELYPLYARKCSKCHTLARSINSEYRGDDWNRYVARMSRKPNSGISPNTGDKILSFLRYHFDRADEDE